MKKFLDILAWALVILMCIPLAIAVISTIVFVGYNVFYVFPVNMYTFITQSPKDCMVLLGLIAVGSIIVSFLVWVCVWASDRVGIKL